MEQGQSFKIPVFILDDLCYFFFVKHEDGFSNLSSIHLKQVIAHLLKIQQIMQITLTAILIDYKFQLLFKSVYLFIQTIFRKNMFNNKL